MKRRSICVYCGSRSSSVPEHSFAATTVGTLIATSGCDLVYGGAAVGLMGVVADAALDAGGRVIGFLPELFGSPEIAHDRLTELHVVETMHVRKAAMAERSDAFLAMPGGIGTFEEICEAITWSQIGLHTKPCGLLNTGGFYDPLLVLFDRAVADGFMTAERLAKIVVSEDPQELLSRLTERCDVTA